MICEYQLCLGEIEKGEKYITESSSTGQERPWHLQCYDLFIYRDLQEDPTRPHEVEKIRNEYQKNREEMIKIS